LDLLEVGAGVSALESTGIYPFNRNRVTEYLFSTPDTSETAAFLEIASPNMVLVPLLQ
jgi:hypothetical protein